jgi:hypothetical protein
MDENSAKSAPLGVFRHALNFSVTEPDKKIDKVTNFVQWECMFLSIIPAFPVDCKGNSILIFSLPVIVLHTYLIPALKGET